MASCNCPYQVRSVSDQCYNIRYSLRSKRIHLRLRDFISDLTILPFALLYRHKRYGLGGPSRVFQIRSETV